MVDGELGSDLCVFAHFCLAQLSYEGQEPGLRRRLERHQGGERSAWCVRVSDYLQFGLRMSRLCLSNLLTRKRLGDIPTYATEANCAHDRRHNYVYVKQL
jgi:hypothetical protein